MPAREASARIKINRLLEAAGWHFFPDNGVTANIRVWDLERGNPHIITAFPSPDSVTGYQRVTPNPHRLVDEQVGQDYIVLTQRPTYQSEAAWKNEAERRMLLDTYRTFGCASGQPTFRYSLLDGVKDGYLVNPTVVDARTEVTTELLSKQGFIVTFTDDAGENRKEAFRQRELEKTSKARVCVTVGMMTTGYDCTDILNLGLFRPIFSPAEFIQIKGRGTRKHVFLEHLFDDALRANVARPHKTAFKLFDFFAVCEFFEKDFNFDEVLKLPRRAARNGDDGTDPPPPPVVSFHHPGEDFLWEIREEVIGPEGMRVDRMFFEKFEETVREDPAIVAAVEAGQWDRVIDYVNQQVFDKPEEYYTLDKLRRAAAVDRRITLREILEKIFGLIPRFKSKDELLEEEFAKFVADAKPDDAVAIPAIKHYFKAYITSGLVRDIIDHRQFTDLATNPVFSTRDFRAVPARFRMLVPEYIKDYVSLNQFAA